MLKKRGGQDLSEWALIVALVSVVVMASLFALEPSLKQIWSHIEDALVAAENNTGT